MEQQRESGFGSFAEFYPFYLSEHRNRISRRMHFVGTGLGLLVAAWALFTLNAWWLLLMPVLGYGFAWSGHFFFEKNRPATFRYPFYSLVGDYRMFWQMLTGRIPF